MSNNLLLAVELAGLALLVVAAALVNLTAGVAALGAALLLVAYLEERKAGG